MFPFEDEWEHVSHDEYGAGLDLADFNAAESTGKQVLSRERVSQYACCALSVQQSTWLDSRESCTCLSGGTGAAEQSDTQSRVPA
jgi:hypothetical protein